MPSITTLTASLTATASWNAAGSKTGTDYANAVPVSNSGFSTKQSVATTIANASAGGGNQFISNIVTIAGGGSTTIDLTSLTDILGQTGVSLARYKGILFRLLSVADDATNGTACSGVTIGNNAANDINNWYGGATGTLTLGNGEHTQWASPSAAGKVVDGTHKIIKIANNDGAVTAAVQYTILGATT